MKILLTSVGKFGPFISVQKLEDRWECDGIDYQFNVVGDSSIEEYIIEDIPAIIPVPTSVSPRQIRQALTRANLRTTVETAISSGDQDTKDWYEFATEFERSHHKVEMLAEVLNVSSEQLDALWILAATL